jgi:iron complex transport system substrate-binding protein
VLKSLRTLLPVEGIHLSLVRAQNEDFIIYLPQTFGGSILSEVGILTPDAQLALTEEEAPNGYYYPSAERVDLLDGDIIFMFIAYPDPDINAASQILIDSLADNPLFQSLNATQNDAVYQVSGYWYGDGIYSAHHVLDDIFTIIAGVDPAEMSPNPVANTDVTTPDASAEAFPITVEHKFGTTIITEAPERVVSIGFSDQDPLLALGVVPVAVRYWYGDETNAIFPWAQDEANGANPVVLNMDFGALNYEAILALEPDLISAVYSGITQEEYELLSQIAPTIAQSDEFTDFGMPWQETTRLLGAALGKSDEAEALVSETEALFTAARAENPDFANTDIAIVYSYSAGSYGFYPTQDPRGHFFTDLGFVIPDDLNELAGDSYYADVSPERIDLLDRDLIVMVGLQFVAGGRDEIESDPLLARLNAVQEGRILYISDDIDDALQFSTILSVEYGLEGILPELQAITGG